MKKYDAVIAGYTCLDMIPCFRKEFTMKDNLSLFVPGRLVEVEGMNFVLGGVVPNSGLAMKKFGMNVFLNGLVGNDITGKLIIEILEKHGLADGIIRTTESDTAFSIVLAPPGTDRIFLEFPGCNQIFDESFINFEAVSRSSLFHLGYPPLLKRFYQDEGEQLADLLGRIQYMDVLTSLDFSLPDSESESGNANWPKIMSKILPYTDIFVPSLEELIKVMQPWKYEELLALSKGHDILDRIPIETVREIGKEVIRSGVKILMIKAGHRGIYLLTGETSVWNKKNYLNLPDNWNNIELWCDAFEADVSKIKNSSGAGDTAAAAFLSAILKGESPERAVKYAALAGRNNLYCLDQYEDLAGWQEMTTELKEGNIKYF